MFEKNFVPVFTSKSFLIAQHGVTSSNCYFNVSACRTIICLDHFSSDPVSSSEFCSAIFELYCGDFVGYCFGSDLLPFRDLFSFNIVEVEED